MKNCLAITGLAIALSGCASWPDKPVLCFKDEQLVAPRSASELKAVEFVKRKEASSCKPANVECNLQLRRVDNSQIKVLVFRSFMSGDPPACTHLEGGFKTYVFSAEGEYIRVELGL